MTQTLNSRESNEAAFLALLPVLVLSFPEYNYTPPTQENWQIFFQHKTDSSKAICFSPEYYSGKFRVSPRIIKLPHYSIDRVYVNNQVIPSPSVEFSIDRPVEQLAKGIKTRFIPDFEIYHSAWIDRWNVNHNFKTGTENSANEIHTALQLPETSGEIGTNLNTYRSTNSNLKLFISSVYVSSENGIEIKTNYLTKAQAVKLINFIASMT